MYSKDVLHLLCNKENNMKWLANVTALFLLLVVSVAVFAADIQVRVFERGGKAPLAGVAVCVGTSASISQFGAMLTGEDGTAMFSDVPRATVRVTASRAGYKAEQETLVISTSNRMLVMSLPAGGGGMQCPLGENAARVAGSGLDISRFAMNNGAAVTTTSNVTLNSVASGQPTQYRASERADFKGADWQDYAQASTFQLSQGPGRKIVYFQVRRHATLNGASMESLSPVRQDSIVLQ
jgi:hypothetical protein